MRMDPRISARLDPSDIVQETLRSAHVQLSSYLDGPQRPFYPWLRSLAIDRLIEMYRAHVGAQKRSVLREQNWQPPLNDQSSIELAQTLIGREVPPSRPVLLEETQARVHEALAQMRASDREVLVLRHLEQLSVAEIADVLGISHTAASTRHLRALQRIRRILGDDEAD